MSIFYKNFQGSSNWLPKQPTRIEDPLIRKNKLPSLIMPLLIDTEFQSYDVNDLLSHKLSGNIGITNQICSFNKTTIDEPKIYKHYDNIYDEDCPYNSLKYPFTALDFLHDKGYKVEYFNVLECDTQELKPCLEIDIYFYAHFAIADVLKQFKKGSELYNFVSNLYVKRALMNEHRFFMKTRLLVVNKQDRPSLVTLPGMIKIDGITTIIKMQVIDTIALVGGGISSYKGLLNLFKVELKNIYNISIDDKDLFNVFDKENMLITSINKRKEFDTYAKGDMYIDKILICNDMKHQYIRNILSNNCTKFINGDTGLTNGKNVANFWLETFENMLETAIDNNYKLEDQCVEFLSCKDVKNIPKLLFKHLNKPSNASSLIKDVNTNKPHGKIISAKVFGGRCYNNRPLTTYMEGAINDIDISGCYQSAMSGLQYPIGKPCTFDNDDPNGDEILTLKSFMKGNKKQLVDGLYQITISTCKDLTFNQDLIPSWIPPAKTQDIIDNVTFAGESPNVEVFNNDDLDNEDAVDLGGSTTIWRREITNGVLTSDILEIIYNVWKPSEIKEFFEVCQVTNYIYYPKDMKCKSLKELIEKSTIKIESEERVKGHKSEYTNEKHIKTHTIRNNYWYTLNISDILGKMGCERKKAKTTFGVKSAEQTFFKLYINTSYGVFVSPYFDIGNVVLGNNITASARCMCYMMEKSLNGFQSITDGTTFDLNQILTRTPKKPLSSEMLCNISLFGENKLNLKTQTINKYTNKTLNWGSLNDNNWSLEYPLEPIEATKNNICIKSGNITLNGWSQAQLSIDTLALEHINNFFGKDNFRILRDNIFHFESKMIYHKIITNSKSNYRLCSKIKGVTTTKMRGYESSKSYYEVYAGDYVITSLENPSDRFFNELETYKGNCKAQPIFVKVTVLKPGAYTMQYKHYQNTQILPGDNVPKVIQIKPFKHGVIPFKNRKQQLEYDRFETKVVSRTGGFLDQLYIMNCTLVDGDHYDDSIINVKDLTLDFVKGIYNIDNSKFGQWDVIKKNDNLTRYYLSKNDKAYNINDTNEIGDKRTREDIKNIERLKAWFIKISMKEDIKKRQSCPFDMEKVAFLEYLETRYKKSKLCNEINKKKR